ncbi:MipA/OmpV family protein [Klebsiella sp. CN_Kp098]|uniref:MipA/OmpV family protein n=1 Tax=unclassified Klebsiella TaxID=2608929 RepID=UPI0032B5FA36
MLHINGRDRRRRRSLLALALVATLPATALAAGNDILPDSIGLSALMTPSPYKRTDADIWPVPIINYDNDTVFVHGLSAGAWLWKDRRDQLSVNLYYSPLHFNPDDSDDRQVSQLNKRRSTLMGGLGWRHHTDGWGTIRTELAADLLGNSNGLVGDAAWLYPWTRGNWSLVPGIGVTWDNANTARYYYGISQDEAARSGLKAGSPGSSWSPYVELSATWRFAPRWSAFVTGRYTHLATGIQDSEMVDGTGTGMLWTGVTWAF